MQQPAKTVYYLLVCKPISDVVKAFQNVMKFVISHLGLKNLHVQVKISLNKYFYMYSSLISNVKRLDISETLITSEIHSCMEAKRALLSAKLLLQAGKNIINEHTVASYEKEERFYKQVSSMIHSARLTVSQVVVFA